MECSAGGQAGPSGNRVKPTWGLTLRLIHRLGYRIPDLAWLTLQELAYLWGDDEELSMATAGESDAAFTL